MRVYQRAFIPLLISGIASCASSTSHFSPSNELLTGTLVLVVQDTIAVGYSRVIGEEYIIDFDAGEWRRASRTVGERSACTYRLRGRRLYLELEVDLKLSPDRIPPSSEYRDLIIVKGKFAGREGDFLQGPFTGTIAYDTIRDYFNDYRQEWVRSRRSGRPRKVIGKCIVNNEATDGLWAIPPFLSLSIQRKLRMVSFK